jgi:hypothetical protein
MASECPVLPPTLDLEHAILNAALEWERYPSTDLDPAAFSLPANRMTAAAIVAAHRQGLTPGYQVVRQTLRERGELDDVGEVHLHGLARDGVRPSDALLCSLLQQLANGARQRRAAALVLRYAQNPATIDADTFIRDVGGLRVAPSGPQAAFRTAKELSQAAERVEWIVRGYLARGAVTELTGKPKVSGKTTLIGHLIACILDGDLCLGTMAVQSPVVFLTEQTHATCREVLRRDGLLHREDLSILSYWDVKGVPWPQVAEMAMREAERIGSSVLFVDTLAQFAGIKGDGENQQRRCPGSAGPTAGGSSPRTRGVDLTRCAQVGRRRWRGRPRLQRLHGRCGHRVEPQAAGGESPPHGAKARRTLPLRRSPARNADRARFCSPAIQWD